MKSEKTSIFFQKLKSSFEDYALLSFWMFCAALSIRLFESFLIVNEFTISLSTSFILNLKGLYYDIIFYFRLTLILFPVYFLLSFISKKVSYYFLLIFNILLLFISLISILYFLNTGIPLDSVFLAYSIKEIFLTVSSSKPAPWWTYVLVIIIPVITYLLATRSWKLGIWWKIFFIFIFLGSLFLKTTPRQELGNKLFFFTKNNKVGYLYQSIREGIHFRPFKPAAMEETVLAFQQYFPHLTFPDPRYPLLHLDSTVDVLSSFFNFSATKPNFVFIIVEGLGREFSGPHSKLPSATPFLDSLATSGLYWEHCLSTSQRTIGALPSIFAALPFGKKGIMTYKNNIPDFHSLIKILINNGYDASFFYGGWLCFDDMCYFLERNQIHHFIDESKYKTHPDRTQWGLYDHTLFKEAIKHITFESPNPRLEIYLTLTTHDPFEYPNSENLTNIYTQKLKKVRLAQQIPEKFYQEYASFLYLDQSLQQLINDYSQKPEFENTIFIITGDHHFNMEKDNFEIYQVPLLIWSPLLRHSKQFPALVSHRDITPTLLAMMKSRFHLDAPTKVTWINEGLDTASTFRSKTFAPLMDVGRNLSHFLYQDYFIEKNEVFKIKEKNHHLEIYKTEQKEVEKLFQLYKNIDLYVVENDLLIENAFNSGQSLASNILNIDNDEKRKQYYQQICHEKTASYHEKEEVLFFSSHTYPCSIFTIPLKEKQLSLIAEYQFAIYIPTIVKENAESSLLLVTEIKKSNGKVCYFGNEALNSQWYGQFDQWATFSFKNIFKKQNYNYEEGDTLTIYIHNPSQRPFYLSDLQISIQAIQ